jgi:hypothetical protein
MSLISFFTDEDVYGHVAEQLRAAGIDAISTPEAGRLGSGDPEQLSWAAQQGRALITFNVGDFARLHYEWISQDLHHARVIVSQQRPLGDLIRRLLHLSRILSQEDMRDRLEYLSNWPPS